MTRAQHEEAATLRASLPPAAEWIPRPLRDGERRDANIDYLALCDARDYWDGALESGITLGMITALLRADDAKCYPAADALAWLVKCLHRWQQSQRTAHPLTLDQAFGIAPTGKGGKPAILQARMEKRNQFLAYHMGVLTVLGYSAAAAADMLVPQAKCGGRLVPKIAEPGVVKAWPRWRKDYAGWLNFAMTIAQHWTEAERQNYLAQYTAYSGKRRNK